MGYQGHCRIRPVHVAGLIKRYRQLLGEKRHVEIHSPEEQEQLLALTDSIVTLREAIVVCASDTDLSSIRPIPFRRKDPLPEAALTRAVLSVMRVAGEAMTVEAISTSIVHRYELHFGDQEARRRLNQRIQQTLTSLASKEIVHRTNGDWHV